MSALQAGQTTATIRDGRVRIEPAPGCLDAPDAWAVHGTVRVGDAIDRAIHGHTDLALDAATVASTGASAGYRRVLRWVAVLDDAPHGTTPRPEDVVGRSMVALPQQGNTHTALVYVGVDPAHRRRGVGTALARLGAWKKPVGVYMEKGIDALGAAAALATRLIALPGEALPGERAALTVGTLHSGTAENALADRAELTGILRTLGPEARARLKRRFREIVEEVMADWGATCELELRESYPGVVNDDGMTALVQRAAEAALGAEHVRVIEQPTLTTEDFGEFLIERPGSFYHVGAGCGLPLHNTGFLPDDGAAAVAAAVHAAVIEAYLRD